jgi:hypothetical protein
MVTEQCDVRIYDTPHKNGHKSQYIATYKSYTRLDKIK